MSERQRQRRGEREEIENARLRERDKEKVRKKDSLRGDKRESDRYGRLLAEEHHTGIPRSSETDPPTRGTIGP